MMARIDTRVPWGFLILSSALLILSSTFATPISSESSSVIDGTSNSSTPDTNNLPSSSHPGKEDMTFVSKSNQALDTSPSESEHKSEVSGTPSPSLTEPVVSSASDDQEAPISHSSSPVELTGNDDAAPSLAKVETLVQKIEEKAKWSLEPLKKAFHALECSLGFNCNSETSKPAPVTSPGDSTELPSSLESETNVITTTSTTTTSPPITITTTTSSTTTTHPTP